MLWVLFVKPTNVSRVACRNHNGTFVALSKLDFLCSSYFEIQRPDLGIRFEEIIAQVVNFSFENIAKTAKVINHHMQTVVSLLFLLVTLDSVYSCTIC